MNTIPTTVNRQSLFSELALLPKPFYLLMAGSFINRFGHFVIPFLAIYMRQLGLPTAATGYALAAYGVGGLSASLAGGYLADRIGRKPTLLISCFGAGIAMILLSLAKTVPTLVAGTFLTGFMTCIYYPASSSLIADLIEEDLRIRAYAVQRFVGNLAFACGMSTAGLLASSSFTLLFIIDASSTIVLGLIILLGLKRGIGKKSQTQSGWGEAMKSIAKNTPFIKAMIASFFVALIFWQLSSSLGLQIMNTPGLGEKTFGFLMGLNGVMIVLLELPLTSWSRKHPPRKMIALGYFMVGGGLALLAINTSLPMLILAMVVLTFGEMISLPVNSSYVVSMAPEEMRGRYMGVMGLTWNTAIGVGPMVGLWIFGFSPTLLWILCGLTGLLSALCILSKVWEEK